MLLQNQKYFFASKVLMDLKTDCHSVHHAFSACSFGLQYETEVFMPLQLSDSCLVDAPVSDWKLAITESLHLCIYSMRGAIKWLVLDHHPNPWDVVCAVLYSNSKMLRCVTVSILFHLHTSKWI